MNAAYLTEKIAKLKILIDATEDAVLAITSGAVEEYRLDTGQTVTNVTKINLATIQKVLDGLYNRLAIFEGRLNGGQTITVRPAW